MNFGNNSKVFLFTIQNKSKVFVYQENDGNLLIFNKNNLKLAEKTYYIKTAQTIKIVPFYDYFVVLNFQGNGYQLKMISKTFLQIKKEIQQEKEKNIENFLGYDLIQLKNGEVFEICELTKIEHVTKKN